MLFSIALLVISLNMDSLGAGLVYGMQKRHIPTHLKLLLCALSIIYSGFSLFIGRLMSTHLNYTFGKYLGIIILLSMGIYSLRRAIHPNVSSNTTKNMSLNIKPMGLTITITKKNLEKSDVVKLPEALLLGFALSIDAIGASISFCLIGCGVWLLPAAIGLCQLIFLDLGLLFGKKISNTISNVPLSKTISILPGLILITLALLRL